MLRFPSAQALCVPLAFASAAFSTMVYRVVKTDPESTVGITEESAEAIKRGQVRAAGAFGVSASPRRAPSLHRCPQRGRKVL